MNGAEGVGLRLRGRRCVCTNEQCQDDVTQQFSSHKLSCASGDAEMEQWLRILCPEMSAERVKALVAKPGDNKVSTRHFLSRDKSWRGGAERRFIGLLAKDEAHTSAHRHVRPRFNHVSHVPSKVGEELVDVCDVKRSRTLVVRIPYRLFDTLLRTYALFSKKPPFTSQQLAALVVGDMFEGVDIEQTFGFAPTPFQVALEETLTHPVYSAIVLGSPH